MGIKFFIRKVYYNFDKFLSLLEQNFVQTYNFKFISLKNHFFYISKEILVQLSKI